MHSLIINALPEGANKLPTFIDCQLNSHKEIKATRNHKARCVFFFNPFRCLRSQIEVARCEVGEVLAHFLKILFSFLFALKLYFAIENLFSLHHDSLITGR